MKNIILALLMLTGCASEATNYDVRIGALDPPQCHGYMTLDGKAGFWRCYTIGGDALLDLTTPGVVFLNLETTPGAFSQVRAVYEGANITGQIFLDGNAVSFFATKQ